MVVAGVVKLLLSVCLSAISSNWHTKMSNIKYHKLFKTFRKNCQISVKK